MNNQEKNSYVKNQLRQALIALLKEKKIEDIAVRELTAKAQVGRASFYRNYETISDILYEYDRLLLKQWATNFEADPNSSPANVFGSLFQHYKDHGEFYMVLYHNHLTDPMLQAILAHAEITPELSNAEAYKRSFWAYGIYGWLLQWMERGMQEDASAIPIIFSAQK